MSEVKNNISQIIDKGCKLGENPKTNVVVTAFKGVTVGKEVHHLIVAANKDTNDVSACYVADGRLSDIVLHDYMSRILRLYDVKDEKDGLSTGKFEEYRTKLETYINVKVKDESTIIPVEITVTDEAGDTTNIEMGSKVTILLQSKEYKK